MSFSADSTYAAVCGIWLDEVFSHVAFFDHEVSTMAFHLEEVHQTLVFAVANVQKSLTGDTPDREGHPSINLLTSLVEQLDGAIGCIGPESFHFLCPNQVACDGSCFPSEQGVWKACKHVLLPAINSILCAPRFFTCVLCTLLIPVSDVNKCISLQMFHCLEAGAR